MKKKLWLIILLSITLSILAIAADAYYLSMKRLDINYTKLSSLQIPKSHDDLSIALISDIEYGTFLQRETLEKFQKKLENIQPDILLFAGDMFDTNITPTESDQIVLTNFLSSFDAKYGKFAVLGEMDEANKEVVEKILYDSNFEMIENQAMRIRKDTQDYIYLVGLPIVTSTTIDTTALFADIPEEAYVITLCHTPDIFALLPTTQVDVLLSGHSHGYQINIPFYGSYETLIGNENHTLGLNHMDGVRVYVSKGIGTTKQNIRLFCDPEIPIFRLKSNN